MKYDHIVKVGAVLTDETFHLSCGFYTTTDDGILFKLPDYQWIDHYPNCDGESDRWNTRIIGTSDEIFYPART